MHSEMDKQKTTLTLVFSLSTQNLLVFKISFHFTSRQAKNMIITTTTLFQCQYKIIAV